MANLLLIHNEPQWQKRLQCSLPSTHCVIACNEFAQAIELLKESEKRHLNKSEFDVILSAVHIDCPDKLTVFDLLKWTKGNPQCEHLPFILLCTAPSLIARYIVDAIRQAGNSLGAAGYLVLQEETFNQHEFTELVESYLPTELRSGRLRSVGKDNANGDQMPI